MASIGPRHLTLLLFSAAWIAGCGGTSDPPSDRPTITQFQAADSFDVAKDTLAIGQILHLSGKAGDDQGLKSWSVTILDSAGKIVDSTGSPVVGTSFSFDQPSTLLQVPNDGSWGPSGSFTVRLTLTSVSGAAAHVDLAIRAKGTASDLVSQGSRQLGAQADTTGSFLDVTRDSVWKSGPKPYSHIDIVFGIDGGGVAALMSPLQAYGDGFDLSGWPSSSWNSTTIVYSPVKLVSVAQVQAVIESGAVNQKAPAQVGWYALKLADGTYAALWMTSLSSTTDSTATARVEVFE